MRFEGEHTTVYRYTRPVFLEPVTIRLRPRTDPAQRLVSFRMDLDPAPAGSTDGLDACGNPATWAWFDGTHPSLEIRTSFVVDAFRENPFDFIVPDAGRLPLTSLPPVLDTYRAGDVSGDVRALGDEIAGRTGGDVIGYLRALTERIYEMCEVVIRPEGDPWPADETLRRSEGSCRDLTVLFMAACSAAGIPARFVSGYQEGDPDTEERDLHAWAEAYIPGGGWRGFDPTHGLAVADRHIALAAGPRPQDAAPTSGTFRGTGAEAQMEATIDLRSGGTGTQAEAL